MKQIYIFLLLSLIGLSTYANTLELGFIADAGKKTTNAAMVLSSMSRNKVFNLVMAGDNLYSSTYDSVWQNWLSAGFNFQVTSIGNHNGGYAKEVAFFKMPGEYYSRNYGIDARFIVLNSDNQKTTPAQMKFLENELLTAKEQFIFLVYHHPSYTISHFHKWTEKRQFQLALRPLLWKYRSRITGILAGHDHLALIAQFNDLPVFISGAVQEVRSDSAVNQVQDGVNVKTLWFFQKKPHWTRLTFDSASNSARIDYIRAFDDKVVCTANVTTGHAAILEQNCITTN